MAAFLQSLYQAFLRGEDFLAAAFFTTVLFAAGLDLAGADFAVAFFVADFAGGFAGLLRAARVLAASAILS
ncbi:MAG: hypothetical protein WBF42_13300, partial [Terracidiphilus sp.]